MVNGRDRPFPLAIFCILAYDIVKCSWKFTIQRKYDRGRGYMLLVKLLLVIAIVFLGLFLFVSIGLCTYAVFPKRYSLSDTKKWERKTQKAQRTKLAYFTGRKFRASDWLIFLSRKNRSPIGRPFISLPHSSSCQAPPSRSLRRTMRSLRKKTNRLRGGMNNCR